jgi:hypothetical protein
LLHESATKAAPLQTGFDRHKPDNAETPIDNIQPGSPDRRAVAYEKQRVIVCEPIIGMPFIVADQASTIPKDALAYVVICRPVPIAYDALEMDRRRHVTFLRTSAGSAVPPAHP